MRREAAFGLLILAALCWSACGSSNGGDSDAGQDGGEQLCDLTEHPCPAGQRCDSDQHCVPADPLAIVTEQLPPGRVGFGYDQTLEASGGLAPYSWEISAADPGLEFLSLSSTGRLQGNPGQVVQDASLTVAVTDSGWGPGERVEKTFSVSIDRCRDGDTELCYAPAGGICYQGSRTCRNGEMSACQPGLDPSADRNQCGPDCGRCDAALADACHQGVCACGSAALCTGQDRCCDGACIDTQTSGAHCGLCFHDCAQAIAHASAAQTFCAAGACDFVGDCDYGFLDCDAQRNNGCERPANRLETCGACDLDCGLLLTHVPTAQKLCRDTGAGFVCDYTGACISDFADCDLDRSNACETWLNQPTDCGACGLDCSQAPAGELCLSPDPADPYAHQCGCNFDSASGQPEGCAGPGAICCEHACRAGGVDPAHCGVCRAACLLGGCQGGACGCASDGDCPAPSSATACGPGGRCVCPHSGAGDAACQIGQFCCDGSQGGSGAEPDLGCCTKQCGQNDSENFPCTL